MKRILSIAGAGAVALVAATVFFGKDFVTSHLKTATGEVKHAARELTNDEFEYKRITNLLQDLGRQVVVSRERVAEVQGKVGGLARECEELEGQVQADRADLLTERNQLAQAGVDSFEIRGGRYTRAQVEASALARVARMERLQSTLGTKRKGLEHLRLAVKEGEARLQQAEVAYQDKTQELELLRTRLGNAKLLAELASLADPLNEMAVNLRDNEFALSLKAYEERIKSLERENELSRSIQSEPALIQHGGPANAPAALLEKMDRMLNPPPAAPTCAKETRRPSAS